MISGRGASRTRRYLLIGLMLSLMVHLFGGSLYGLLARAVVKELPQLASLRQPPARVQSDVIRLEKAEPTAPPAVAFTPPHPHKQPPPPPPAVHPAPAPVIAPAEIRHEIAHVTHRRDVPREAPASHGESVAIVPHVTLPAVGPKTPRSPAYSQEQRQTVPDYTTQFEAAIHSNQQTLQQANNAMATAPKIATSHFQMSFNGIHEGLAPGDGIITVISYERRGNVMWYWTHYQYMYGDGHVEEADIPWPFHYGPGEHDPFASHDRRVPIQPPPASYHPPPGGLPPQLMQFFGGPEVR